MDLLSNLQKRYHDLLSPVQQGLSQVGKAINSNPITKTIANTAVRSVAPMVANNNSFTNAFSQAPKVDLTSKIKNPYLKFGASIPESIVNSPRNTAQGMQGLNQQASNMYLKGQMPRPQTLLSNVGKTLDLPLNLMGGSLLKATGKNVAEQGFKQVGKQGLFNVMKEGALEGGKLGTAFGFSGGLQNGENINNPLDYAKNLGINTAEGTIGGAVLGGLGAGGIYGVNKGVNEINLIKTREALTNFHNDIKSGAIANSQNPIFQKYKNALGINSKTENTILKATQRLANKMDDPSAEFVLERSKSLLPPEFKDQPTPVIADTWNHIIARKNNRIYPGQIPQLTQDLDKAIFKQFGQGGYVNFGAKTANSKDEFVKQFKQKMQAEIDDFTANGKDMKGGAWGNTTYVEKGKMLREYQKNPDKFIEKYNVIPPELRSRNASLKSDTQTKQQTQAPTIEEFVNQSPFLSTKIPSNESISQPVVAQQPIGGSVINSQQPTAIAVRQSRELVPTANSQKSGGSSEQAPSELVPSKSSLQQQQQLSGGEQPPIKPPEQLAVGSGQIDPKQSSEGIISSVRSKINKIYTETLDRFHPLSSIANKAGEDVAMRRALTGHYGAGSTAQYHIDYELAPILKSTDVGELRKAAIALRDAELKSRGIKGSNTDALSELLSKQGKNGLKDPEMGVALKKLYKYQDDLVKKYLVGTDIMTQKAYNEMKSKNQFYIPFKRVMDDVDEWLGATPQKTGVGSVGSQNIIKKIKGSDRDIQDPLESIIENTYKIVGLAKRQEVAQTLASLETKLPKGTITKAFGKNLNPNNYFSVFEKGKAVHYKAPVDVIESAKGLNQDQISTIVKILAAPTRVFRATATGLNPEFMLPNITRDLQSAFVNIGLNPLKFVSGLSHYMKRDEVYQDFIKAGGLTSQVSLDRPYLKKTVGEISSNKRGISVLKGGNLFDILAKVGQASEQPTRLAAFQKTLNDSLKKGIPRNQALQDAAYAAQESTINFGRRGSKTQSVNMIYAFMNARAQGTDRLIRSLKSDPKGAGIRMGMLTIAPAIGLYAYNRGFESYNDERIVPPYEKENNFIIMLSDTPIEALGGAQYAKIPKGDIGKLANPIEQFMSYADGKGGDVQSSLLSTLKAFSPATNIGDVVPTALRPAVENAANYNFFQKRAIVSESKQNYPAKFQFNKNTSGIYKEIGSRLNVSPAKVENIVRGYLTGFARIGEMMAKPLEKEDKYSGQDINQTPVARRFLGGAVRTEEEQQLNNYFEQKGVMNKVQDIKTGIKYGNIPVEDGLNEINKLLETNKKELQTKPQSNFGVKASNAASSADVMRQEIEDSQLNLRVEMSGKSEYNSSGDIVYKNENGNAATIKLSSPTKGVGIGAFANQNWNITKAREVWNANIPQDQKDQAFKRLGVKSEDVRYDALANYSNDTKTQYVSSKSQSHKELINNLLTGRKRSIGDNIFASDGVIDNLVDEGKLTKEEGKALKAIDYNKDGTKKVIAVKGRKPKAIKLKHIEIKFNKGKRIKVKAYKSKKVKQYKLTKVSKLKKVKKLKA